jgi:hypothetical protein
VARALLPANQAGLLQHIDKHVPEEFASYEMREFALEDLEWWVVTILERIEQHFILTTKDTKSCEEKALHLFAFFVSSALKALVFCVPSYKLLHKDLLAG